MKVRSRADDDGPTVEDLEAFYDRLQGPLGEVLRTTGTVIERKMRERGVDFGALTDLEVVELFNASFAEAAARTLPQIDPVALEASLGAFSANAIMALATNANSTNTVN
ncbi:hypothetical protein MU852_07845 [Brevundimonas albigilva]|uniref:Uncharacterized protein n=1 Tax=Brevundimonas albigilva TaxID=1312364 RepID=A0ABY4SK41_9CAUL|nr:hypothetical protein [Brevundimonas albigilva]UQV19633.1 hypothetical protein MU852_07845 [Brevundimonas albigilva]URI15341.1 hypothetical protein M8231_16380 [Brevundimonas albigilva]